MKSTSLIVIVVAAAAAGAGYLTAMLTDRAPPQPAVTGSTSPPARDWCADHWQNGNCRRWA